MSKELRERLRAVDPDLTIIPPRHHKKRTKGDIDWEKAGGIICENCGKEVFRSRDGLCMPCWELANEFEVRDNTGITNWLPMDIINMIAHPARKEQ